MIEKWDEPSVYERKNINMKKVMKIFDMVSAYCSKSLGNYTCCDDKNHQINNSFSFVFSKDDAGKETECVC